MGKILIAGLDGSLRNFGVATAWLDLDTLRLEIKELVLVKTEKSKNKSVRASSDNLARAIELRKGVHAALLGVTTTFYEVPSGGQDYNAVLGFGIVIGTYAGINIPGIEVSPSETKMGAVGTKTASKDEMIEWAFNRYPLAPWRVRKLKGETVPTKDNEHLADAVAIMEAGIHTPSFQQTLAILRSMPMAA
ncbi:hypothetical protein IB265_32780 [Ensifer sp. ENS10]|uniref:hypothetical protein n=1 Tax=Ensifer sp. ENS10 TaxID=2769286 RepID=UPI0017869F04|nr:hypothetical protein [Ensifer sp. ENS10]MBD9511533.1 hypothetical protein [Ensifer sp. ENS10]